jgi:predicted RNase H-like HicB family nuclease
MLETVRGETHVIRRFKVEVTTDNTGWVSVKIPAVPEVHAEAHTREQALRFAARTVSSHLKSLAEAGGQVPDSDVDAIVVDI